MKCLNQIELRFCVKVQCVESNGESMFKGKFQEKVERKGINWNFVKHSVSGSMNTKVGVVERFSKTLKPD